ncbi:uncharacterized protein TNCT_133691 [Trichonephila clavata]|uniref:Uncharacterized protein n=1 Tax=Trichonephila clavata TaxID=2740835 RepID=A0A8X6J5F0_TRICU|nr:uncharacterized protein TNCT_133691 [Trichonephila clavata]
MWFSSVCIALFLIAAVKAREDPYTICPEPDRISPCVCEKGCDNCQAVIVCKNIMTQTTLQETLDKIRNFPLRTLIIQNSSFQFIPHEVFLKLSCIFFTIKNCTLVDILDDEIMVITPLQNLVLLDLKIQKTITFRNFSNLRRMTLLHIENTEYKKIKQSDMEWLPRKLETLFFVNTKTLRIEPNAFKKLKKLEFLSFRKNDIKSIESNMFPENLLQLILSDNKLKSLPSDLSAALPKLNNIYVENNRITSFAEAPFGKFPDLAYIQIEGNLVACDCESKWVVGRKRPYIEGICENRKDKKKIRELEAKDFAYCPEN